jgi:diguanylate cyclase (GGDEF)-like protein
MRTHGTKIARKIARLTMRNPEQLWQQYGLARCLFLGLTFALLWLNGSVIERGIAASEGIKSSNQQVIFAQSILNSAEQLGMQDGAETAAFHKTVTQFETAHSDLLAALPALDPESSTASEHAQRIDKGAREFVALARSVANAPLEDRGAVSTQLAALYSVGGLHNDLLLSATMIAQRLEADTAYFAWLQRLLLAASAFIVIVEAVFVLWPAQYTVHATIAKMKRQTFVLRRSQARLKQVNIQLKKTVNHNQLTGLPNRTLLEAMLGDAISKELAADWQLYLVGIDDFKSINDMLGHAYGDALLIAVSQALKGCVDDENIVAHVSGDEFVLIADEPPKAVLRRIMNVLSEPFDLNGRRISIKASIGHLCIGDHPREPMQIVADAAIALQSAKGAGGDRTQEFTRDLREGLGMMQKLQMDLREAIEQGQIEPWFQPQVRLADGKLHGAEVLARWRHPTRGLLTPDQFLPAAERAGLMIELDHAVWASAMRQAHEWENNGVWRPVISLNAAPDTIADPNLIERFLFALRRSGLELDQVIIEVLETTLINGKDDMAAINIDSLAECGIALELDDFGTGYASLSKLTQLPLSGIKLDRSLIAPLPDQAADSVVRAILALAGELGLHVVAEGVEELEQAEHLNDRGCNFGQGYGFGRPMPPQEFTKWLGSNAENVLHAGPETAPVAYRA